jgi:hypothetical protein
VIKCHRHPPREWRVELANEDHAEFVAQSEKPLKRLLKADARQKLGQFRAVAEAGEGAAA